MSLDLNLDFDWSAATTKQKQMLFAACNRLRKRSGVLWPAFLEAAGLREIGPQYEQNARRGKISNRNAAAFFHYLRSEHPIEAMRLVAELRKPIGGKKSQPSSYNDLLFRKKNYSGDGPIWQDEEPELEKDPDLASRRKRKKD